MLPQKFIFVIRDTYHGDKMIPDIERKILVAIAKCQIGLNISEVAIEVGITRITAKKHLLRLTQKGGLEEARKGRMRIFWRGMNNE